MPQQIYRQSLLYRNGLRANRSFIMTCNTAGERQSLPSFISNAEIYMICSYFRALLQEIITPATVKEGNKLIRMVEKVAGLCTK